MLNQSNLPGHISVDQFNQMLAPPELFAPKPEFLSEQLFIERSFTENRFWLRIMKEHSLFFGGGI